MFWRDRRILDRFGIEIPVIQAPMAGATTPEMVVAVSSAGGLGSLPTALYGPEQLHDALMTIRAATTRPFNVNFFAHSDPAPDPGAQARWRARLAPFYIEAGLDPAMAVPASGRAPFGADFCDLVETSRPAVVSFHFGLPDDVLLDRVKATGARVIASATTVAEAVWLAERGVDAVIAMGFEAGGHRGNFLSADMATQVGTLALVPQVVDAVRVPVIAAGGIADGRGMAAALALGAAAVQVGTAYLFTPEARLAAMHAAAIERARDDDTALTNLFTGRPARGVMNRLMREVGPLADEAPAFPTAGSALLPIKAAAEAAGRDDFTNLWVGQAAPLARATRQGGTALGAAALTRHLAARCLARLAELR